MDTRFHANQHDYTSTSRRFHCAGVLAVLVLLTAGMAAAHGAMPARLPKGNMQLTSTAFKAGEPVPAKYTCEGKNISPPLQWTGVPAEAKSLVLIVDDPGLAAQFEAECAVGRARRTIDRLSGGCSSCPLRDENFVALDGHAVLIERPRRRSGDVPAVGIVFPVVTRAPDLLFLGLILDYAVEMCADRGEGLEFARS